ncbi:Hypothetical predicted protein [Paramuricea clavata]|uniref:Uncharacterized protein n=1 Tax=Paramuricea clavata TaxID=317549 RepID=A0A6S7JQF1_PARCT|nr:Hypothetical predicted protein [Paramuricea clavata]
MSFSREYAHRLPIPTAEEILEDFNSTKNKDFIDPLFNYLPENELNMQECEHKADKDSSPSTKGEQEKQKEITDTYNKVSEFLEQNKNLRQSITSMNELAKELHAKKENLTQLISNINENMQEK